MIKYLISFLAFTCLLNAQQTLNEDSRIEAMETPGVFKFTWLGRTARTYFLQNSQDLQTWVTLPIIEIGTGERIEYGFATTDTRFFFRLRYSDLPSGDVRAADFDDDGISNWDEIQQELDPFNPDTDGDGMDDGYELANGLNPELADGSGDVDFDGVPNDEDARPNVFSIGRLSISIGSPVSGAIIQ